MKSSSTFSLAPGVLGLLVLPILFTGCDSSSISDAPGASLTNSATTTNVVLDIASYNYDGMSSHIVIDDATINIRSIELATSSGSSVHTLDKNTGSEGSQKAAVVLFPDMSAQHVATFDEQVGAIDKIRFEIYQPEASGENDGSVMAHAILITGTVLGEPFELAIDGDYSQEIDLSAANFVDDGTGAIDIGIIVDAGKWFIDEDGSQLNPLDLGHHQAITNAVHRSFRYRRRMNPRYRELVGICHFENHVGPETNDFVLLNTRNPVVCLDEGGTPSEVTRYACRYRHHAIERYEGFDCRMENLD